MLNFDRAIARSPDHHLVERGRTDFARNGGVILYRKLQNRSLASRRQKSLSTNQARHPLAIHRNGDLESLGGLAELCRWGRQRLSDVCRPRSLAKISTLCFRQIFLSLPFELNPDSPR